MTLSHQQLVDLRRELRKLYNKAELRTLCFDLGVEHEDLPDTLSGMSRELIAYCERHDLLPQLVEAVEQRKSGDAARRLGWRRLPARLPTWAWIAGIALILAVLAGASILIASLFGEHGQPALVIDRVSPQDVALSLTNPDDSGTITIVDMGMEVVEPRTDFEMSMFQDRIRLPDVTFTADASGAQSTFYQDRTLVIDPGETVSFRTEYTTLFRGMVVPFAVYVDDKGEQHTLRPEGQSLICERRRCRLERTE